MIVVFNDMMKSISIFLGSAPTLNPAADVMGGSSKYRPHPRASMDDPLVWMTPRPYDISSNGARLA